MAEIPLRDLNDLIECTRAEVLAVRFVDRHFGHDLGELRRTVRRRVRGPRSLVAVVDDIEFEVEAVTGRYRVMVEELVIAADSQFWEILDDCGLTARHEGTDPAVFSIDAGERIDRALHIFSDAFDQWTDQYDGFAPGDAEADRRRWLEHQARLAALTPPGTAPRPGATGPFGLIDGTDPFADLPWPSPAGPPGRRGGEDDDEYDGEVGDDHDDYDDYDEDDLAAYDRYMASYLASIQTERYRDFLVGLHDLDDAALTARLGSHPDDVTEWRRSIRARSQATPPVGPAAFLSDVTAFHTERTEERRRRVGELQAWVLGLGGFEWDRLLARYVQFLEEEGLPVNDPEGQIDRAVARVLDGPAFPGEWDPGDDRRRWVGWLLLLAVELTGSPVEGLAVDVPLTPPREQVELPVAGNPHVLLGRTDDGLQTHPVRKGFVVRTGPAGTGKTSTARAAHLAWHGPSISFTIRPAEFTPDYVALLLEKGPVHLLNATDQLVPLHPAVHRVRWSPLQLVTDWDSAVYAAHVLLASVPKSDLREGHFWDLLARCALGPMLYAASLRPERYTMRDVAMWTTAYDAHEAEVTQILARSRCVPAQVGWTGTLRQDPRTKSSIFATAETAITSYWFDRVDGISRRPNFDADSFLASNGTVLVLADALRAELTSTLYTTFLDELIMARKRAASDPEHPAHHHPLYLDIDEAANTVRIPSLASLCTTAGGFGIAGSIVLHDHSQALDRWGVLAPLFVNAAGARMVFPGTAPSEIRRTAGELAPTDPIAPDDVLVSTSLAETPATTEQVRDWADPVYRDAAHRAMVLQDPRNDLWRRPGDRSGNAEPAPPPVTIDALSASRAGWGGTDEVDEPF